MGTDVSDGIIDFRSHALLPHDVYRYATSLFSCSPNVSLSVLMMRMSVSGDTDVMKVPEAADSVKDQDTSRTEGPPSPSPSSTQPVKHSKLVRSLAMCEESFPCPFPDPSEAPQDGFLVETEECVPQRDEEEEVCDKPEKKKVMLSRDSSQDYTDSSGVDLHQFLVNTLQGNPRDRIMLLKLEQDILEFISNNDVKRKFPPMTSYHRMLLHRVAAYFGMDHNVDPSGKSVVINKTSNTRIPNQKFSDHIKDDRVDDFQKRYILKRDNAIFDPQHTSMRMRLKADRRSKSMEEREEEYQRARERIFAHDSDHFILDRSSEDGDVHMMSSHQRRQMFRLRACQSGHQSSSETETLGRHGDLRPWSSTDSSDSCNRPAPRPPMTKASSFSGTSPCLVRGDSTASSRSTGRLSKTGSESCSSSSSIGSSSSSLSRLQLPLPGSPSTPVTPPEKGSNYLVLPREPSGTPGGLLVHPHTGKPFIPPDVSAVLYSPVGVASAAARIKAPQQPITAVPQTQPANQLLPQPDALNTQFSHMTLTQQTPPSEGGALAPDPRHFPSVYHHHPSPLLHGPPLQQVTSYMVAAPTGGPSGILHGQPVFNQGPNHALNPPLHHLQQPPQQMSTCYCASGLHPHCSAHQQHHYRLPYAPPQSLNLPPQHVHPPMMSNPSSYQTLVGLQPTPTLALTGNQQSTMGNHQVQGMMVQYPQMQAYHQQVSVPQHHQYQHQHQYQYQYQQPVIMSSQPCYSLLPPHHNQHTTMSSTVSFLPGPIVDQLSQAASPCISQQHAGPPQFTGLLPPSPAGGMLMLQMTTPTCQQPRGPSPCQRKLQNSAHKHPRAELHRGRRPTELLPLVDPPQSSLPLSPALPRPPSANGLHAIPVMSHPTVYCHSGPGDTHYSLLGGPLQYTPPIPPPLIRCTANAANANHMFTKHQGSLGVWRSAHGKKANRKCQSVDVGVAEQ